MDLFRKALLFLLMGLVSSKHLETDITDDSAIHQLHRRNQNYLPQQVQLPPISVKPLKDTCYAAGKRSIGDGLEDKLNRAKTCIQSKINLEDLQSEVMAAARYGSFSNLFRKICNIWPGCKECIQPLINDANECYDKQKRVYLNQTLKLMDDGNDYFCENDHQRMSRFIGEGGMQCIQITAPQIQTCARATIEKRSTEVQNDIPLGYSAEDCSDMRALRKCVVSEMRGCQNSAPGEIIDGYFALVQHVVCNSATNLNRFSAINIFLCICLFLYSKLY